MQSVALLVIPGARRGALVELLAERPRYRYDPLLATVEDFTLPAGHGSGELTVTVTRDGQLTLGFGAHGRRH